MFGGVDPIYMLMLIKNLGGKYMVWDKSASIRFRHPGKTTLFADFSVTQEDLDEIKTALNSTKSIDRIYTVELKDKNSKVHAEIEKVIHISKRPNV